MGSDTKIDSNQSGLAEHAQPARLFSWRRWLIALVSIVLLCELAIELDLIPVFMMAPNIGLVTLVVIVFMAVALALWRSCRRHGRVRFSTASILAITVMTAWPIARLSYQVRQERQRAGMQQKLINKLTNLNPKQISLGGRFNDGHHTVAGWLSHLLLPYIEANLSPPSSPKILNDLALMAHVSDVDLSSSVAVTDATIPLLIEPPSIERLDLSNTAITDAALDELVKLKTLRHLKIANTAVTETAIEKMKAARPDLEITK